MKTSLALALTLVAAPALAKPANYFPLVDGTTQRYAWSYEGRSGVDALTVRKTEVGGKTIFYFDSGGGIIGANGIGLGVYEVRPDGVYTQDVFWKKDLPALDPQKFQRMLPAEPTTDWKAHLKGKDHDVDLAVRGYEDIKVAAGEFKKCLVLSVDAEGMKGTAWLAPDVGVVKWKKHTGRIAELTKP